MPLRTAGPSGCRRGFKRRKTSSTLMGKEAFTATSVLQVTVSEQVLLSFPRGTRWVGARQAAAQRSKTLPPTSQGRANGGPMGKSTLPSLARPPAKPKPVQKALPVNNRAPRPFSQERKARIFLQRL